MNRFSVLDLVDVKSWNDIAEHCCIGKCGWDEMVATNPHQIALISHLNPRFVQLENSCYCWPIEALEFHTEQSIPQIDDLI